MTVPAPLQLPASVRQHRYASGAESAQALTELVAGALRQGVRERGAGSLIVSGGRSPVALFEALSVQALAWDKIVVSLADDRWVAADDADSNEHLVRTHLLQGAAAAARLVPLVDVSVTPEQHLAAAELALAGVPHPYDAVLLGAGDDGHTASMFPGADATPAALDLRRPQRLAAVTPKDAPHRRISLTLRALLDARLVAILIAGAGKRAAIELAARSTPEQHPIAAFLQQDAVPVHVFFSP